MRQLNQKVLHALKSRLLWLIIGILLLTAGSFVVGMKYQSHQDKTTALAQNTTKPNKSLPSRPDDILHITGTISKIDGVNLEVKDETSSDVHKLCGGDRTTVQGTDGKKISLADLKVGTRVRVTGKKQTGSCYQTDRLVVMAAKK